MSHQTQIELGFQAVAAAIKPLIPPPLDAFATGWAFFPFNDIEDVITTGNVHAALSFGQPTPTVNGVVFEQSNNDAAATVIPNNATGWTGTNWQLRRADQAPVPPTIGNQAGRTFVTPFADLTDPTFGDVAGVEELCETSMRRNFYLTFNNLTIGNRYYAMFFFGGFPGTGTATYIEPEVGDRVAFGVDGINTILSQGIRRFGFTATATSMSFLKVSQDNNGSHCNAALCLEE